MTSITIDPSSSNRATSIRRVGIGLSAVATLFLFVDAASTLLAIPPILAAAATIGFPATSGLWHVLGAVLMLATVLYAVPRTSVVGAIIATGYLGGAICAHVRMGEDVVGPAIVCVGVATLAWAGLVLRDGRLREAILGRSPQSSNGRLI